VCTLNSVVSAAHVNSAARHSTRGALCSHAMARPGASGREKRKVEAISWCESRAWRTKALDDNSKLAQLGLGPSGEWSIPSPQTKREALQRGAGGSRMVEGVAVQARVASLQEKC